jgi:angio-associated migratory cell protein
MQNTDIMDEVVVSQDERNDDMKMDTKDSSAKHQRQQHEHQFTNSNEEADEDIDEDDDDIVDDIPDFINPEDVEEVKVDDDDIPMDDDEIEEANEADLDESDVTQQVTDMSNIQIKSHTGPVYTIASYWDAIRQKLMIISGGGDDKAYLHRQSLGDPSTGRTFDSTLLQHLHSDSVSSVATNIEYIPANELAIPNNPKFPKLIAVGGYDGIIALYDAESGEKVTQLEGPTDVEWISFHPKGGTVLLVGSAADGTVWMFHMLQSQQYKCLQVFVGHEQSVNAGTFSADGKWALTASSDGTVRIWAPRTGLCKHVFRFDHINSIDSSSSGLTTMSINGGSDGQLLLVGSEDGYGHVCHIGTKKVLTSLRHYEPPVSAIVGASTSQGDNDDINMDVQELPMSVEAVGFAPAVVNPNWCATGGVDGIVKIWDLSIGTGQCRQVCQPPIVVEPNVTTPVEGQQESNSTTTPPNATKSKYGGITRLQWHPTLPIVIVSHTGGIIHFWDARNGRLIHSITGSNEVVNDMTIHFPSTSPDIQQQHAMAGIIVTGSDDNTIRLFDIDLTEVLQ